MPAARLQPRRPTSVRPRTSPLPQGAPDRAAGLPGQRLEEGFMLRRYAIRWSRVPEPLALVASVAGLLMALAGRL